MAPKSFNQDGAAGGWGGDGTTSQGSGAIDPVSSGVASSGGDGSGMTSGRPSEAQYNQDWANINAMRAHDGLSPMTAPNYNGFSPYGVGSPTDTLGGGALGTYDGNGTYTRSPMGFDDGGAMPDDDGGAIQTAAAMPTIPGNQSETPGPYVPQKPRPQTANNAGDGSNLVDLALADVQDVLKYTRNKFGLGGGDQQAGAMPMIPGNQSETPGPYVPQQPKPQQVAGMMPTIPGNQSETPGPYVPQQPKPQQFGAIPDDDQEAA
jgi:hypothetical protein